MTISGFQIEETIDRETSGDLEKLLLAVGNGVLACLALGCLCLLPGLLELQVSQRLVGKQGSFRNIINHLGSGFMSGEEVVNCILFGHVHLCQSWDRALPSPAFLAAYLGQCWRVWLVKSLCYQKQMFVLNPRTQRVLTEEEIRWHHWENNPVTHTLSWQSEIALYLMAVNNSIICLFQSSASEVCLPILLRRCIIPWRYVNLFPRSLSISSSYNSSPFSLFLISSATVNADSITNYLQKVQGVQGWERIQIIHGFLGVLYGFLRPQTF